MPFSVETTEHNGRTVYTLLDLTSGALASVLPSYGFNLFDLRLPVAGIPRRVIVASDDFAENPVSPGRNGTPVLFPFPNRIRDSRYSFEGKSYDVPTGGKPLAIHGFAISAAWDVVDSGVTDDEAYIVGRFQISKNHPEMLPFWPTDAILTIRYGLAGSKLTMAIGVENPTEGNLPYGFGIHPYFRIPFTSTDPADGTVILPASSSWVQEGNLPTGEVRPVEPRVDFREGQTMAGQKLDDILTDLAFDGDHCVARLVDTALGAEFRLSFGHPFRELVVFTPPFGGGTLIAVEPYTQTTDAINLEPKGIDAGLRILGGGQSESLTIVMETIG
jgi:aldose 1-epimerase